MATTSTIGSASRNYSTPHLWLANFTPGGWIGECYNDSAFNFDTPGQLVFNQSTSSTNFITLRAASGHAFYDNMSGSDPLHSDSSKGVSFTATQNYKRLMKISCDWVTVRGIQFLPTNYGGMNVEQQNNINRSNCRVERCIMESGTSFGAPVTWCSGVLANCLISHRIQPNYGVETAYATNLYIVNCTIVQTSNLAGGGTGFSQFGSPINVINCAIFGFNTLHAGSSSSFSGSNNCSDLALTFGMSNQSSKTYANQFQNNTQSSRDFRLKSGSDCIDNGTTASTQIPSADDIIGTSRPSGSAWDIGCWELVAAAASMPWQKLVQDNQPRPDTRMAIAI